MTDLINEYFSLALVAGLAFLSPLICNRLRVPVVVGEVVLGIMIGLTLFIIRTYYDLEIEIFTPPLEFLADIGLVFLLFLAGLEIDFQRLEDRGPGPFMAAVTMFVVTLVLAFFCMQFIGFDTSEAMFMAVLMSTTSIAVVLPTLREITGLDKDLRQNILIVSLIADMGSMALLTAFTMEYELGPERGTFSILIIIPFFILLFYAIYRIGGWAMWHFPERLAKFFHPADASEHGVRMAFALMFLFVGFSILLGIEAILGAFLGGIFISLLFRESSLLEKKLFGIGYGFIIPIFFIYVGVRFDITQFGNTGALLLVPVLVFIAIAVKVAPAFVFLKWHNTREVVGMGVLSSARLSLILAAATVGLRLGIVDDLMYSTIVLLVIILSISTPVLFRVIVRKEAA